MTLNNCHQLKGCLEFFTCQYLGDFDKVPGGSVSMPFSHIPNDLRTALKLNDNFGELELDGRGLVCL